MTDVQQRTCGPCRATTHERCEMNGCICMHPAHMAYARPGDKLSRLPGRIRGCAALFPLDPKAAKEQMIEVAELVEQVVNNVQTMRWLFGEMLASSGDIASRLSITDQEQQGV